MTPALPGLIDARRLLDRGWPTGSAAIFDRDRACVLGMVFGLMIDICLSPLGMIPAICSADGGISAELLFHVSLMPVAHVGMVMGAVACADRHRNERPVGPIFFAGLLGRLGMMIGIEASSILLFTRLTDPVLMMGAMAVLMLVAGYLPGCEAATSRVPCERPEHRPDGRNERGRLRSPCFGLLSEHQADAPAVIETGHLRKDDRLVTVGGGHDRDAETGGDHVQDAAVIGRAIGEARPDAAIGEVPARLGQRLAMSPDDHDLVGERLARDHQSPGKAVAPGKGDRVSFIEQLLLQETIAAVTDGRERDIDSSAGQKAEQFTLGSFQHLDPRRTFLVEGRSDRRRDDRVRDAAQDPDFQQRSPRVARRGLPGQAELALDATGVDKETRAGLRPSKRIDI